MKCKRIRIENIGPVTAGVVDLKKFVVFFGPNNTGKSIVSRLIHALRRLDTPQSLLQMVGHDGKKKISRADMSRLYGEAVLLHSALERGEVITHGHTSCRLVVTSHGGQGIDLDFSPPDAAHSAYVDEMSQPEYTSKAKGSSVYIPAGRTGTVQSLRPLNNSRLTLTVL